MLRDRLVIGIPLAILALVGLCVPGWLGQAVFLVLAVGLILLAAEEFFGMTAAMGVRGYRGLTAGLGLLYLLLAARYPQPGHGGGWEIAVFAVFVFVCFGRVLRSGQLSARGLASVWVSIAGFVYLFWCLSFLLKLFFFEAGMSGRFLLLYIGGVTKAADMGAYLAGSLTARRPRGNHKLVPSISPKKSWEGLAGGIGASLLVSFLLTGLLADHTMVRGTRVLTLWVAAAVGLLAPLIGLLGDLAESALKRAADRKDSGAMRGLGGALDILDSLIPVAPLFYAYVTLAIAP